jgi:hypothetical protein
MVERIKEGFLFALIEKCPENKYASFYSLSEKLRQPQSQKDRPK